MYEKGRDADLNGEKICCLEISCVILTQMKCFRVQQQHFLEGFVYSLLNAGQILQNQDVYITNAFLGSCGL